MSGVDSEKFESFLEDAIAMVERNREGENFSKQENFPSYLDRCLAETSPEVLDKVFGNFRVLMLQDPSGTALNFPEKFREALRGTAIEYRYE